MNSFRETQRQFRIALIAIGIILIVGVVGFMTLEKMSPLDSIWLTVITLATIGYGDIYAKTEAGRIFTLVLILGGLSVFAFALQAGATFLVSPAIRDLRQKRRIQHEVEKLSNHYIICGVGEMVDKTITYLLQRAESRRRNQLEQFYRPLDRLLDRVFGVEEFAHDARLRRLPRWIFLQYARLRGIKTLLDVIVVITTDSTYADHLRNNGLLVIEGKSSEDDVLRRAGIERAQAMMVMLDNDTEALFTVLTARSHNANLYITAATLEEELSERMTRVGANSVIAPFDVAGNFLNSTTLRPTVSDYFRSLLFDQTAAQQAIQLYLSEGSLWLGQALGNLKLRERFQAGVIGIREQDSSYAYAPADDFILKPREVIIAVVPTHFIGAMVEDSHGEGAQRTSARAADWASLTVAPAPVQAASHTFTLEEAEKAIEQMSEHFVICGTGRVARNAINKLNPERPFVVISDDEPFTQELLARGFRVVHGSPTHEKVQRKAGVDRALAAMVSIEDKADSVLTILTCRALSKRLLITATAAGDDVVPKLRRAGADRIISPFQIAAQFVLQATTTPAISDFMQYVLFNYQSGLETTELYMEEDSPWIGETIETLQLDSMFHAGVIGIRRSDGSFIYAPPSSHQVGEKEVLIVTTPMIHADELRVIAHGSATKRPKTLRRVDSTRSGVYSRAAIDEAMKKSPK